MSAAQSRRAASARNQRPASQERAHRNLSWLRERPSSQYNNFQNYEDDASADDDQENDWRRAAQMLTERDEELLLLDDDDAYHDHNTGDALDVAPVRRNLMRRGERDFYLPRKTKSPPPARQKSPLDERQVRVRRAAPQPAHRDSQSTPTTNLDDEDDDNSSLSFAQSGCQSILSAWRIKAANKAARLAASATSRQQQSAPPRPVSVLSNTSSQGKRSAVSTAYTLGSRAGKSPAAKTRIPLGPKTAQHFVTNSRRRRRANELILNTLEARRRALALNRQNLGSLFGSDTYLLDGADSQLLVGGPMSPLVGQQHFSDYQRLSMSPSPGGRSKTPELIHFESAREQQQRGAQSDLGGTRGLNQSVGQRNARLMKLAAKPPLLSNSTGRLASITTAAHKKLGARATSKLPPIAKLDQNSSDLCSSNSSSSGNGHDDDALSSDGSQFTQLVSSELAPVCILLDEQQQSAGALFGQRPASRSAVKTPTTLTKTVRRSIESSSPSKTIRLTQPNELAAAPKVPERSTRPRTSAPATKTPDKPDSSQYKLSSEDDDQRNGQSGKFRRGALKRDSIRRLRLNRAAAQLQKPSRHDDSTDQSTAADSTPPSQKREALVPKPLPKDRKLDIESNPFLNRHHFRTMSTRSQSTASDGRQSAPLVHDDDLQAGRFADDPSRRRTTSLRARSRPTPTSSKSSDRPKRRTDEDEENIRRVEQMLRQMGPNQVFASNVREKTSTSTKSSRRSEPATSKYTENFQQQQNSSTTSSQQHKRTSSPSKSASSSARAAPQQPVASRSSVALVAPRPPPPTRPEPIKRLLVNESARRSDDLSVDARGNRSQLGVDERWRHERVEPTRLANGSIFSEERLINERVEVLRQQRLSTISPPTQFADSASPTSRQAATSSAPASRATGASTRRAIESLDAARPIAPAPRSSKVVAPPDASRRALSEERRPVVPPRPAPSPRRQVSEQTTSTTSRQTTRAGPQSAPKHSITTRLVQADLPKFERTADDEFRKRVDQLRQMARANLAEHEKSPVRREQTTPLTKPLSTNWSGLKGSEEAAVQKSNAKHPLERSRSTVVNRPLATDLDDLLLADGYQRPLVGAWRRSNSSLASVGHHPTATRTSQQTPARKSQELSSARTAARPVSPLVLNHSPNTNQSMAEFYSSESVLSQTADPPKRVVVRERSTPRLDYAIATTAKQRTDTTSVQPRSISNPPQRPASLSSSLQQRERATPQAPQLNRAAQTPPARPPTVTRHVRSPELSGASSFTSAGISGIETKTVAAPLGALMTQPKSVEPQRQFSQAPSQRAANQPAVQTTHAAASPTHTITQAATRLQTVGAQNTRPTGLLQHDEPVSSTSSALQSILRRQQQQQQQQQQLLQQTIAQQQLDSPTRQQRIDLADFTGRAVQQAPQTSANVAISGPSTASGQLQQQQSTNQKRVHFNDRTSIRSFESISSINSESQNATALQNDLLRQQIGSPDSMGSGSTSRFSADSPDLRKGNSGGAAIYAIRGDPELEIDTQVNTFAQQQQLMQAANMNLAQQQQQQQNLLYHQQQTQPMLLQMRPSQAPYQAQQQQQRPFIRMNAPPTMGAPGLARGFGQQQAMLSPQQRQFGAMNQPQLSGAPLFSPVGQPAPQQFAGGRVLGVVPPAPPVEDEDDPNYTLRLRQAATSRVFNYIGQPAAGSPNQPQPAPNNGQATLPPRANNGGGGGGVAGPRRQPKSGDLANFHTEV